MTILERDLRSLGRPGLQRLFAPLDARERLPREAVIDTGIAVSGVGRRWAALLWPLAFLAGLAILAVAGRLAFS